MSTNAVIGALHAVLGLDSTNFETGLKAVPAKMKGVVGEIAALGEEMALGFERSLEAMQEQFNEKIAEMAGEVPVLGNAFTALGTGGLLAAAALGGVAEAMEQAHKAMEWGEELQNTADHIGVAASYLQTMQFAGKEAGVSVEAVNESLQNLNASLGAFQSHVGDVKLKKVFEALGIDHEEIANMRDASQLLPVVAEKISELGSRAEQVQFARKLGIEALLPLLQRGKEGIAELSEEADKLGVVLDDKTVKALHDLNKESDLASTQIGVNLKRAFANLAPEVTQANTLLAKFTGELADEAKNVNLLAATFGKGGFTKMIQLQFEGYYGKGLRGDDLKKYMEQGLSDLNDLVNGEPTQSVDTSALKDQMETIFFPEEKQLKTQLAQIEAELAPKKETIFSQMNEQIDTLNKALKAHLIDQQTYSKEVAAAHEKANAALKETNAPLEKLKAQLKSVQDSIVPPAETIFAKMDSEVKTLNEALSKGLITQQAYFAGVADAHAKAAAAVLKTVLTPDETAASEYRQQVAELDEALKRNIITGQQWNAAMAVAMDKRNEADKITPYKPLTLGKDNTPLVDPNATTPELKKAAEEMTRIWNEAFGQVRDIGRQALDDIIERGRVDWRNLMVEIINHWDQVAIVIQKVWQATEAGLHGGGIGGFINAAFAAAGHNADGTDYWPGGLSWVGERGPELVNLPRGASVESHESILAATRGGNGMGLIKVEVDKSPYFDVAVRQAAAPQAQQAATIGSTGGSQMATSTIMDLQRRQIP